MRCRTTESPRSSRAGESVSKGTVRPWHIWLPVSAALAVAVVVLTWALSTHPTDGNPWKHLPPPKDATATVSAGEDCGSFPTPQGAGTKVDMAESKIVVNQGSITCGEATSIITIASSANRQTGVEFPVDGGWLCTVPGESAALLGYKVKCQKDGTEIRLVSIMDRNASNVVDNRIYQLPSNAPGVSGKAFSVAPPNRNVWCQINLDPSGKVKDVVCQGELPPDAPLVNGLSPNSVVLDPNPSQGSHFAVLDTRIVDFVPPLSVGSTIRILNIECTATKPDELTCTANMGTPHEHGFTISSHTYELR